MSFHDDRHRTPPIDRVAGELGLLPDVAGGDRYVWNGYPVSFNIITGGEDPTPSFVTVEILVSVPGKFLIRRRSFWIGLLRRLVRSDVKQIAPRLELTGHASDLALCFLSDAAMAKTLPLALARLGDEIRLSDGRLRVQRRAVDGVAEDALKAAWSLATSVIRVLNLPRP